MTTYLNASAPPRCPRSTQYVLITARFTNENAARAPKEIIEETVARLMNRAVSPNRPTIRLAVTGVRYLRCRRKNSGRGRLPSRPMAKRIRDTLAWLAIAHANAPATWAAVKNEV